jgi:glutaredoxin
MIDLLLYTRRDCCLCDTMKAVVEDASRKFPTSLSVVDVDSRPELAAAFGEEVPVLFIDGIKFAKYRADPRRLRDKLATIGARRGTGG